MSKLNCKDLSVGLKVIGKMDFFFKILKKRFRIFLENSSIFKHTKEVRSKKKAS